MSDAVNETGSHSDDISELEFSLKITPCPDILIPMDPLNAAAVIVK
jgi:hypothetical protein